MNGQAYKFVTNKRTINLIIYDVNKLNAIKRGKRLARQCNLQVTSIWKRENQTAKWQKL